MKIYKVHQIDHWIYDDYENFVVRATNEDEAFEMCKTKWDKLTRSNVTIEEINSKGKAEIIVADYIPG